MVPQRVLVLDVGAEVRLCSALQRILTGHFQLDIVRERECEAVSPTSNDSNSLRSLIRRFDPLLVFLILPSRGNDNSRLVESVRKAASPVPIIAVVESCDPPQVLELFKAGAADFITSPFDAANVLPRTWKLAGTHNEKTQQLKSHHGLRELVGESPDFMAQLEKIPLIAKCSANVVIEGETGTGKEVYARAIHYSGPRSGKPFVPVNCGALPVELVENELFGHERGAYTGAITLQPGLIEEANGGTLFLDEIDCLPLLAQVKLLRFLQEKEYKPLGSSKVRRADVRIIAASNLNLERAVENGRVRQDLFYRLNIISLTLPPLRERREDIPLLCRYFVAKYAAEFEKTIDGLSPDALQLLMCHSWPGNIRELEHVIERATVMTTSSQLHVKDILPSSQLSSGYESLQAAKAKEIAKFERNYIQGLLSVCRGNITRAAQVAQKDRRAFWQLIQKHRIDVAKYKHAVS